jgi:hypothetical protein
MSNVANTTKPHKKFHPEQDIFAPLVGMNYRVGVQLQEEFARHVPFAVRLEREPENKFDVNALKVVIDKEVRPGMHIGYISRDLAARLAVLMDEGMIEIEAAAVTEIEEQSGSGTVLISFRKKFSSNP